MLQVNVDQDGWITIVIHSTVILFVSLCVCVYGTSNLVQLFALTPKHGIGGGQVQFRLP